MLKLSKVSKNFLAGDVQTNALVEIDLEFVRGDYLAITGPSGCGKSTLLSILGLLDAPTSGAITFENENIKEFKESELSERRRGRIGFIFQNYNLIEDLSVFENIALALNYNRMTEARRKEVVFQYLEKLGIAHRSNHRPSQLSGGQQQRAAIARALVVEPKLLLADEPTGNLDTHHGDEVMSILENINQDGTAIVMVTHSSRHASMAKRALRMLDGRICVEQSD